MDNIVVSTRKREENLQNVPVAITAITSEDIQKQGITDIADIGKYTSSIIFDQGFAAQDTRITIRGLAPTRGRQNVAVLVDGVDISSQPTQTNGGSLLISQRLFDLERIEVVKGPQNALYGRTAFAGAINYITKKPTDEVSGSVYTDIGANGQLEARGGFSGPLAGTSLRGGINFASWNHDGYYRNSVTGGEIGGTDGWGVAGTLAWDISDDFTSWLRAEYTDDDIQQAPYGVVVPTFDRMIPASAITGGVISAGLPMIESLDGQLPDGDDLPVTLSPDPRTGFDYPGVEREIFRATLNLEYDFGPVLLTSLTHLADTETDTREDARRSGGDPSVQPAAGEFFAEDETELFSQELRLSSNTDGNLSWTVGALWWDEDNDFLDGSANCIGVASGPFAAVPCGPAIAEIGVTVPRNADLLHRDIEHWSVYGLMEWEFAENLMLVLEGRYTDEELTLVGPDRSATATEPMGRARVIDPRGIFFGTEILPNRGDIRDVVDDDFFSPKATLQWTPNDDRMYYLSWAEGSKPAGSSVVGQPTGFIPERSRFDREEITVYELGAKTDWLDNRLVVNAALFFQDYTDKQVSSQAVDPISGLLIPKPVNAAAAEVWGLELEGAWQLTDELLVSGSYTYLDTEYREYTQLSGGAAPIASAGNCTVVNPADPICELDLSGNELEGAPEHSFVGSVSYRRPMYQDLDWLLEGNLVWQDERFADEFNTVNFDSYTIVDVRAGFTSDRLDVSLYIDNLFENDALRSSFRNTYNEGLRAVFAPPPFTLVLPSNQTPIKAPERQYGLRAVVRFGET